MADQPSVAGIDPWDGDSPIFDPKCPECGRFYGGDVAMTVNGAGEILDARAECSRCGPITPQIVCWKSDLAGLATPTPSKGGANA